MNVVDIFTTIFQVIVGFVVVLVPIVAIHEFGHLLISRMFGVKIPEYGIGLPLVKRTFYTRFRGIIWSFYWPLLGGFVRIYGDNDAIDEAHDIRQTDPEKSKQVYRESRFQELVSTREIKFFLEDNNLVYTKDWQDFVESDYIQGKDSELENVKSLEEKYKQILTLIDWEYDNMIDSKETFYSKNWIQQTLIVSGGILFNFASAFIFFWILFTIIGIPAALTLFSGVTIDRLPEYRQNSDISITSEDPGFTLLVVDGSLAAEAGLTSGDRLLEFAGTPADNLESMAAFSELIQDNRDQTVDLVYVDFEDGSEQTIEVTLIPNEQGDLLLGVGTLIKTIEFRASGPIAGTKLAFDSTVGITRLTFQTLVDIIKALFPNQDRAAIDAVGGPIAIGSISFAVFDLAGIAGLIFLMATISISLAVFNMIPIPALDGGRWVILTLNKILGKRNRKIEAAVISATFILILLLAAVIAFRDVQGIIQGRFDLN
jgi:regulator of sigma E protease